MSVLQGHVIRWGQHGEIDAERSSASANYSVLGGCYGMIGPHMIDKSTKMEYTPRNDLEKRNLRELVPR